MSLLSVMRRFVAHLEEDQHKAQQRWLRDMFAGIVMSRSLMLSEIGRSLNETARDGTRRRLIHTEKRLSRGLNSDRLDDEAIRRVLLERAGRLTLRDDGDGVVVAIDYTDLAKPYARPQQPRGMELACKCHDGSRGSVSMGYPIVQIEASLPGGATLATSFRNSVVCDRYPFATNEKTR